MLSYQKMRSISRHGKDRIAGLVELSPQAVHSAKDEASLVLVLYDVTHQSTHFARKKLTAIVAPSHTHVLFCSTIVLQPFARGILTAMADLNCKKAAT